MKSRSFLSPSSLFVPLLLGMAISLAGCGSCGGGGDSDSGIPVTDSTPGVDSNVPGTDSNIPGVDSGVPGTDSNVPGDSGNATCGDSVVQGSEQCDDGNMNEEDSCLNDCTFACGDGIVNMSEACDTGIAAGSPGACPMVSMDCDDMDGCTTDTVSGTGCQAACVYGSITTIGPMDSCCPMGADETSDPDCMPICDNGVVEMGETCDPIASCPTGCDDMNSCTTDGQTGDPMTCDISCTNTPIMACTGGDSCCPMGCDSTSDSDCSSTCDDGTIDPGETCDPIATCATDCDDMNVCTTDVMTGAPMTCNVICSNTTIMMCGGAEGCCPAGCDQTNDVDCPPVCGDTVVDPGEQCDDGNTMSGDGCDAMCQNEASVPATAFRVTSLFIRDPHLWVSIPFLGCNDITDSAPFGQAGANEQLNDAIAMDTDGDGLLDVSFMAIFRPLDQAGAGANLDFFEGECTAPAAGTSCDLPMGANVINTTYTNMSTGTCLDAPASTTSGYTPAVGETTAPPQCWVSGTFTLTLDLGGIMIPMQDVQIAAGYVGSPATDLANGLLRGFISETDADNINLPASLPLIGGMPLSVALPGGTGNCSSMDDRDMHMGMMGWWFYLNYDATEVTYVGP